MKMRLFFLPLFASVLGFSAFLRTGGADTVRTVQIVSLIATGVGLGVALANLKYLLSAGSQR
jgi:hypothetical protein